MSLELVRLINRKDGTYGIHHPDTGRLLMEVQKCDADERAPLSEQMHETRTTRQQVRREQIVVGLVLGSAVLVGFMLGLLAAP